jgi:peroxiredoxin
MIAARRLTFNSVLRRVLELASNRASRCQLFEALSSVLSTLSYLERKTEPRVSKPTIPNALMLDSRQVAERKPTVIPNMFRTNQIDSDLLSAYTSRTGETLAALAERPLFLVFLRHFGCTFCREAVADLAEKRQSIEAKGTPLAFVHLGTEAKAQWFFKPYGMLDVPRFGDPDGRLYEAFGLLRAELRQYLNSESILRMLGAMLRGHFVGFPAGDIERMPGAFLIDRGRIQKSFRHKLVSDRPDYLALATPN